ncbi:hypothetical protein VNO77_19057 [Canavalia gladiata]|uniref:Uncharacterized protein n=1 Tax=Canavalia gladiata TaxID=3824 RepID=A0AAN9QK66_CANGL
MHRSIFRPSSSRDREEFLSNRRNQVWLLKPGSIYFMPFPRCSVDRIVMNREEILICPGSHVIECVVEAAGIQ